MKSTIMMILAVAVLLAGCAAQEQAPSTTVTTVPTRQTEPTTEPTTEPVTEPVTEPSTEPEVEEEPPEPVAVEGDYCEISAYDPEGRLTEKICYRDGVETYRYTYLYDENGTLTEEICQKDGEIWCRYVYDGLSKTVWFEEEGLRQQVWEYDEKGNVTAIVEYYQGELSSRTDHTYDEAGNLTQELVTENGKEIRRGEYIYNEQGHITEAVWYRKGKEDSRCAYEHEYDEAGNRTSTRSGDDVITYAYDDAGHLIQEIDRYDGEPLQHQAWAYDENGNLTETVEYGSDGTERFRWTYIYDQDGRLTEEVYYKKGVQITRTVYTYDSEGALLRASSYTAAQE